MPDPSPSVHSPATTCPRCGADNRCALTAGLPIEQCWCIQGPATLPPPADPAASCFCARCLREVNDAR
jgi:hypothetical protein